MADKKHSAYMKPPRRHATLDHWYGPMQHTADGVASDPAKKDVPPGKLESGQVKPRGAS